MSRLADVRNFAEGSLPFALIMIVEYSLFSTALLIIWNNDGKAQTMRLRNAKRPSDNNRTNLLTRKVAHNKKSSNTWSGSSNVNEDGGNDAVSSNVNTADTVHINSDAADENIENPEFRAAVKDATNVNDAGCGNNEDNNDDEDEDYDEDGSMSDIDQSKTVSVDSPNKTFQAPE